ncbi:phosphoinositide 3-kinase adapter protein 1 isoform X2 [Antennarius striatus]|uniref:phosphoinositide 3-kinase adapter protein 1 isoform X2 n=1 Tax=Antennarius striatus TaxID=241820 RepID=UPI0035B02A25
MEEPIPTIQSADPGSVSTHELLILFTADAHEWATYLQKILKTSQQFSKRSILLHTLQPAGQHHGYNFECFQSCKCLVLLLMGELLDRLCEPELQGALQMLLYPPHRVVALMSNRSEENIPMEVFGDWSDWRKLSAEDEATVYISTILESLSDHQQAEIKHKCESAAAAALHNPTASSATNPPTGVKGEVTSAVVNEGVLKNVEPETKTDLSSEETSVTSPPTCLTVQPNRVLRGEQKTLYIIFVCKIDVKSGIEVEFSSDNEAVKRVLGTMENEYTISVTAPDMPAGEVSLSMWIDRSRVSLSSVTYYTNMGEISRYLENAANPVSFLCQAFNLSSNATESVDKMLADTLKSKMPATGLQQFGVRQIEVENMAAYQRTEELPTLLHFAAKYGLKMLTTVLLHCPGALQAYSVMNKHGDYPNTLAEKSGFSDLRQFMDEFVETADIIKSHFEDPGSSKEDAEVYELMSTATQDIMMKYSSCSEDVYESMVAIAPECADDLYEAMSEVIENPEEAMLRTFFKGKPQASGNLCDEDSKTGGAEKDDLSDPDRPQEDPYNLFPSDVYDIVNSNSTYNPLLQNRPPAPIPRPDSEHDTPMISRVFSDKGVPDRRTTVDTGYPAVRPAARSPSSTYDPYAGMKTPGQRQLISLQERVKVGEISVDDAVQEFQAWKFDNERRANSIRYQKENLKLLRDSIMGRHKDRRRSGKERDLEISAPLQTNSPSMTPECSVYDPIPRAVATSPLSLSVPQAVHRGGWKTGSTSSTSSTESNRLSTFSSGTEPDFEDITEILTPPPRPLRSSDPAAHLIPPRVPPRVPERSLQRSPENLLHERYISCPTRALPQIPGQRHSNSTPPVPRRLR